MPLSVDYSIFADRATIEQGTGKVSLIGIFDRADARVFPLLPTLAFYCLFKGEPGTHEVLLRVTADVGNDKIGKGEIPLVEAPGTIEMPADGKAHFTINFAGLPIYGQKMYFRVYTGQTVIHTNELEVLRDVAGA